MVIDVGRIKHLGDLMHKSVASNGSAVTSNWKLSADGLKNVVWTPEAGAVSYGSNSNEVSYNNAAGASSLVSRADHVHRGVTSLAHASNTYTGPVTLETEGGLYIVRSAANTYRFGSTGGSGGGSALTIEEVDGSPTVSATKLVLPNGTLGVVGTVATYTPSGGGVSWTQDVNESGTSYANFTTVAGTWSSNGTEIIQTDTTAAFRGSRFTTKIAVAHGLIAEAEVFFPTAGQGGGGFIYAAILAGFATAGGGVGVILDRANGLLRVQNWSVVDLTTFATTVNLDTWYKIRAVVFADRVTAYKDGTLIGSAYGSVAGTVPDYVGLGTYGSSVKFRNIKAWTLTGGAPA